jgi:flagellar biosynthesis protein FliR
MAPGLTWSFLLVLARVSGLVALAPLPGFHSVVAPVRVVLAFALTIALAPVWPAPPPSPSPGQMLLLAASEAVFGLAAGLVVLALAEAFTFAAQLMALQAGYAYASTIDPTSEADSSVLAVFAQLTANLLFFAAGLDRWLLTALAGSLQRWPPGGPSLPIPAATWITHLGTVFLDLGARLALPVIALLLMADLTLALLGRLSAQMQLLSLSFPLKMLAALLVLALLAPTLPRVYENGAHQATAVLRTWSGR